MNINNLNNNSGGNYNLTVDDLKNFNMDDLLKAQDTNFILLKSNPYATTSPETVEESLVKQGIPYVLSDTTQGWSRTQMFSIDFLAERYSNLELFNTPRNIEVQKDLQGWRIRDFISYLQVSPEERSPKYLYGKDMPCPREWQDYLSHKLQPQYSYKSRFDLVSHLPEYLQPDTLMSYIGSNGTYTPGHVDLCGSLGQNLMVAGDSDSYSYWFIVPSRYREVAVKFWNDRGGDVYSNDSQFINPSELLHAPFPIYVFKQRVGDFVFIPPDSVYQAMNFGGTTIKIGWNSISLKSLPISYYSSLPISKKLAKPELFRIKAVAYYTLRKIMGDVENTNFSTIDVNDVIDIISPLLEIFHNILQVESILIPKPNYPYCNGETIPFLQPFKYFGGERIQDRRCEHCHSDIFNRCYHCDQCKTEDGHGKDFCFDCVSMGIGCEFHFKEMVLKEFISHSKLKKELSSFYDIYKNLLLHSGRRQRDVDEFIAKTSELVVEECGFLTTATVAYHVVYYSSQKKIKCHRCERRYKKFSVVFCTSCSSRFCEQCVIGFKDSFTSIMKRSEWNCYCCEHRCDCTVCKNNEDNRNLIINNEDYTSSLNSLKHHGTHHINNNNNNNNNNTTTTTNNSHHDIDSYKKNSPSLQSFSALPSLSSISPSFGSNNSNNSNNSSSHYFNSSNSSSNNNNNNNSFNPIHNNNNNNINNNNNNNFNYVMDQYRDRSSSSTSSSSAPITSTLTTLSTTLSSSAPTSSTKPMDIHSKKRPIVLDNDKPKGRPPKNLKEWTATHKFIISLVELNRSNSVLGKNNPNYKRFEELPPLVQLYLSKRRSFGGVLWAKTNTCPLLPCLWVKDLSIIPPTYKLLPSLIQGKKIVVIFFGSDLEDEESIGMVGKKSIFSFDEVNQTLLLKCNEVPLQQLEDLFNSVEPEIATKKDISTFNYKTQIEEKEDGLYVKQELYNRLNQPKQIN